jgi:hypothetical protein
MQADSETSGNGRHVVIADFRGTLFCRVADGKAALDGFILVKSDRPNHLCQVTSRTGNPVFQPLLTLTPSPHRPATTTGITGPSGRSEKIRRIGKSYQTKVPKNGLGGNVLATT